MLIANHCYHVINRGNSRKTVFHGDGDYRAFLRVMAAASERIPMRVLAACLMPNHFHFVLQPFADGAISRWMHWLMTTYVARYRRVHDTVGHIWQGRFKPFLIQQDAHLLAVMRYVERNALRAGLVQRAEQWRWGSLQWRQGPRPPIAVAMPPAPLPRWWTDWVNEPQTSAELNAMRHSVNTEQPFGAPEWIGKATAPAAGAPEGIVLAETA
jgi:putative transposase